MSAGSILPGMSVCEQTHHHIIFESGALLSQGFSVAWSRMDTLGSLPILSASPFYAWPDEQLTACLHPTGWYSLNAPPICELSASWKKREKREGKKSVHGQRGNGGGDPWHKRVMSQLPGPISAWPLAGALWTFSRAALKTWICVRFSPCIFPMFSQNAASVYLCTCVGKMRSEWWTCILKILK